MPNEHLMAACNLTLLFYSAGNWDDAKRQQWDAGLNFLLGPTWDRNRKEVGRNPYDHPGSHTWDNAEPTNEATTKNLCNAVRAAIAKASE